jgi:hypothetical protein
MGRIEQRSQERVFDGVPVTILKLDAPATEQTGSEAPEPECQLGYARAGGDWALTIRTVTFRPLNGDDGLCQFADVKLLRHAPLELRLRGIGEIPNLLGLLNARCPSKSCASPIDSDGRETCQLPQTQ